MGQRRRSWYDALPGAAGGDGSAERRQEARYAAVIVILAVVALLSLSATATPSPTPTAPVTAPAAWERWLHLAGVFDLAGPRADGRLVAAVHDHLALLDPDGTVTTPFAPAYSAPDGSESYIALSTGQAVDGAGCAFGRDEILALDLRASPPGVRRITPGGEVSALATISGAGSLGGITLDTVGDFGHRLLVVAPEAQGSTRVAAVDCRGTVTDIGTVPTALEGGIAVAPRGFGDLGGQLIAANESDGSVYAVSPAGRLRPLAASGLPAGGDIGVESVGFVPASGAAAVYVADRGTPGNPHPGTDSVLRLAGAALAEADVRPGDALVATEGGDTLLDIRCAAACTRRVVATGPAAAHGEGRLLVVPATGGAATPAGAGAGSASAAGTAAAGSGGGRTGVVVIAVGVVAAALGALTLGWRRRRRSGG